MTLRDERESMMFRRGYVRMMESLLHAISQTLSRFIHHKAYLFWPVINERSEAREKFE